MPNIPCPIGITCPGNPPGSDTDSPIANYSSEATDGVTFTRMGYPTIDVDPAPGGCAGCDPNHPNAPPFPPLYQAEACTVLCTAFTLEEAQLCADQNALICATSPIDPDTTTERVTTTPTIFYNSAQTCKFTCTDGQEFTWTVLPGVFAATTQAQADFKAHQYACNKAQTRWICLSDIIRGSCVGAPYDDAIRATRPGVAAQAVTFTIAGSPPPGISFAQTGPLEATLSGTPTTTGYYNFTVTASAADGATIDKSYLIIVLEISTALAPVGLGNSLPPGCVGTAYSTTFTTTGGVAPYTYSIAHGSLPTGLSLSSGGIISGTPTANGTATFTVKSEDDVGAECSKEFSLQIGITGNCPDMSKGTWTQFVVTQTGQGSFGVTPLGGSAISAFATANQRTAPPDNFRQVVWTKEFSFQNSTDLFCNVRFHLTWTRPDITFTLASLTLSVIRQSDGTVMYPSGNVVPATAGGSTVVDVNFHYIAGTWGLCTVRLTLNVTAEATAGSPSAKTATLFAFTENI